MQLEGSRRLGRRPKRQLRANITEQDPVLWHKVGRAGLGSGSAPAPLSARAAAALTGTADLCFPRAGLSSSTTTSSPLAAQIASDNPFGQYRWQQLGGVACSPTARRYRVAVVFVTRTCAYSSQIPSSRDTASRPGSPRRGRFIEGHEEGCAAVSTSQRGGLTRPVGKRHNLC